MKITGLVYLIGAGPGDPDLITVKGRDCIARSDVVVYDYLANERLLALARPGAELIYAGKIGGAHNQDQLEINDLLVAKAQAGHIVSRLKGGDPFIFGRGGEECLALSAAGIPFEVVPGITAALGAAAYAGIPLTHRGVATSVSLITGHETPDKGVIQVDWARISTGHETLVFYMGIKNLPLITRHLIDHGRSPETPVALIRWGTRPQQEVLTGTLADIAESAHANGFKAPAITIVGNVVNLRQELRWFDNRPLSGRSILVTRAAEQAGEFSRLLADRGADVLEAPTISLVPPDSFADLDAALLDLSRYDWLVFSSGNAVAAFFGRLSHLRRDSRAIGSCRICAVGPKTAAALAPYGLVADLVPEDYKAEGVIAAFASLDMQGKRVLFPRADRARDVIPLGMESLGATVDAPVAYRNVVPTELDPAVLAALEQGTIDCVTFTSSSTVTNLAAMVGDNRFLRLLNQVAIASIGPVTSATCRDFGLTVAIEPKHYTLAALTEEIVSYYQRLGS